METKENPERRAERKCVEIVPQPPIQGLAVTPPGRGGGKDARNLYLGAGVFSVSMKFIMNYRCSRLKGILEDELRNLSCLPAPRVPRYQNNLNENEN